MTLRTSRVVAPREHTGDRQLDAIQRNITRVATGAVNAFTGGVLKTGLVFVSGTFQTINHGLGRRPNVVFIACVDYSGSATYPALALYGTQTGIDLNNQLNLITNANCTIAVYFA